jgi:hypothetical protein
MISPFATVAVLLPLSHQRPGTGCSWYFELTSMPNYGDEINRFNLKVLSRYCGLEHPAVAELRFEAV